MRIVVNDHGRGGRAEAGLGEPYFLASHIDQRQAEAGERSDLPANGPAAMTARLAESARGP